MLEADAGKRGRSEGGLNEGDRVTEAEEKGSLHEERRRESTEKLRLHVTFGSSRSVMERANIAGKLGFFVLFVFLSLR